jgi:hypothetical protein
VAFALVSTPLDSMPRGTTKVRVDISTHDGVDDEQTGRRSTPATPSAVVHVVADGLVEVVAYGLREALGLFPGRISLRDSPPPCPSPYLYLVDPFDERGQLDLARTKPTLEESGLLVFYTWRPVARATEMSRVQSALGTRLRGWLPLDLPAGQLVAALEHIQQGRVVIGVPKLDGALQDDGKRRRVGDRPVPST